MLRSDEGEVEVFFDSTDCLSSEESIVGKEEVESEKEFDIWMTELRSVKERRESFLRGMGFDEFASSESCSKKMEVVVDHSSNMGSERLSECSGAVLNSCVSSANQADEILTCCRMEVDGDANLMVDELERHQENKPNVDLSYAKKGGQAYDMGKEKMRSLWKRLLNKKGRGSTFVTEVSKPVPKENPEKPKLNRMKVRQNKKRCMEFTALYGAQEIHAHKGIIWTMKFSPDGQYLASGGEDGIVRIWHVTSMDASCKYLTAEGNFGIEVKEGKSSFRRKKSVNAPVVLPEKVMLIEDSPLQEFHGHASDILDLAWSNSNYLLSSSKDKCVRLWQVGCHQCLNVFNHNDYVTCIQFNPVNDNYFISGSIDGKVRVWGVSKRQVVDWADVRDMITAICYQPDGKGLIVGCITGTCRFYDASGKHLQLNAEIHIQGRRKISGNKITGIQYAHDNSQRLMITSEDSKLRILDGDHVIHKYRGLPKSGSQMSASFTSTGKHIVSVGEDSRVYVWNYDGLCIQSSKQTKSVHSCEHFFSEGVSIALPWSGMGAQQKALGSRTLRQGFASRIRESERFSLGNWFSMDGPCRGSVTWPEEKLPLWDVPVAEDEYNHQDRKEHQQQQQLSDNNTSNHTALSETWGLVILTAGLDGTIRTFHNYGLPVRL